MLAPPQVGGRDSGILSRRALIRNLITLVAVVDHHNVVLALGRYIPHCEPQEKITFHVHDFQAVLVRIFGMSSVRRAGAVGLSVEKAIKAAFLALLLVGKKCLAAQGLDRLINQSPRLARIFVLRSRGGPRRGRLRYGKCK